MKKTLLYIISPILGITMIAFSIWGIYTWQTTPSIALDHADPHNTKSQLTPSPTTHTFGLPPLANTEIAPVKGSLPPSPIPVPVPKEGLWIESSDLNIYLRIFEDKGANTIPHGQVLHYSSTAPPGEKGNSYLYGHGTWESLGPMVFARTGDKITLHNYSNQTLKTYTITNVIHVAWNDARYLNAKTSDTQITLETCLTDYLKGERLVVIAKA